MCGISPRITRLMRPSAAALQPYDPAFAPVDVNLSANENSYGLPASVHNALIEALSEVPLHRYPDAMASRLRAKLASLYGLTPEHLIVGNGGDELLFNLFLAFGGADHVVVHCPPDFSVYDVYARLAECRVQPVWRDAETFALNEDALIEASRTATLTVVTSPNNPTGNLISRSLIERLCQASQGLVLIDEAYMEFAPAGSSCVDLLGVYDNLIVLRTLSKAYALAGARLGYVLADPSVIAALAAVRQPYSVSALDQAAALVVVEHRKELAPTVDTIVANRAALATALTTLESSGVRCWPSAANFLLVRVPHAHDIRCRLRDEYDVLVRDFSAAPGLADCLRITVGTVEEHTRLMDGLTALVGGEEDGTHCEDITYDR